MFRIIIIVIVIIIITIIIIKEFETSFANIQEPARYGFGGSRKEEKISLKAAAVQLATAALHNRFDVMIFRSKSSVHAEY